MEPTLPQPESCPHRPPCGGCPLLELTPDQAAEQKRARVAGAFARFPALAGLEVAACEPAPARFGYRTRLKLACAPGRGRLRVGLFRPGTHEVLDLPGCRVAHPDLLPILEALRELAPQAGAALRHVDARWSLLERRAHLTLVAEARVPRAPLLALAGALRARCPALAGVGLRRTGGRTPRALSGGTEPLLGEPALVEALAGRRFNLSPGAFFQVDPRAAERLHAVVRAWLADPAAGPARLLVDLFAGVGAFALDLADTAQRALAVEAVAEAAEDARRSAALSELPLEVITRRVEDFADELQRLAPDRLVLVPPRRGVEAGVLRAVGLGAPARAAYVACDPETAARDVEALLAFGLAPRRVVPVDLFAGTAEVECVVLLERAPGAFRPAVLARGADWAVAVKPALLPTHPQAPGEPNLRDALRRSLGSADLQPVHRLDVGTSGPVLFARAEALSALGQAFEAGEVDKEYLALVRGVPHKRGRVRGGEDDGGPDEETSFRREDVVGGYGLLRVSPRTGKRHQIRRHLARIGHPILGDARHGEPRANRFLAETCALGRPFLHLARLAFPAPDGARIEVLCPLPPELELVLERLRRLRAGAAPSTDDD